MLEQLRTVTRAALEILELLAVLCGLMLFMFAAVSLVLATIRVAIRGRVLVLPFGGNDPRRVELTDLFVRRLTTLEQEWIQLAGQIEGTRKDINEYVVGTASPRTDHFAPLTASGKLPAFDGAVTEALAVAAPRTSGDELLENVVQLARVGSIMNADLGVISLAGVSFSPRDVLALLRAAPGIFARRTLRGAIISADGGKSLLSVEFEERAPRGRSRRRIQTAEVANDAWLSALDDVAYRLARDRVYLVRDRAARRWSDGAAPADPLATPSKTVGAAVIEASSWEACRAFLVGYAAHLNHYRYGRAADREEALNSYGAALVTQPGFPRAAYNRAALLYNRYHPDANDEAIAGFDEATRSREGTLKALAFAGLAMAHCQAIQRFHRPRGDHEKLARQAAEQALEQAPQLEEAVFANGWILQIDEEWAAAISCYESALDLPGSSAAARRIKSFALNNAAWITLSELRDKPNGLARAERLLWQALDLYPNKVAYANLAEIARRCDRPTDAVTLYAIALALDPTYINALNERAIVHAGLAVAAARSGDPADAKKYLRAADADAEKAHDIARGDPHYAAQLREDFLAARGAATLARG